MDSGQYLPMQFKKVIEVFSIVLVPVSIGMLVNKIFPAFAAKLQKPVKIASVLLLIIIIAVIVFTEKEVLVNNLGEIGWPLLLFNVLSITIGYFVPRIFSIEKKQAISISMEIGIHNGTIAIYIALSVLQNSAISIPPAIYSLLMLFTAALFGFWVNRARN